jgi:Cu2+-containing amine oxidase
LRNTEDSGLTFFCHNLAGDPNPPFARKCAFDVGDYGLGYCADSLEMGCDCVGHIKYFDATMADMNGVPYTKKKTICLHEEDAVRLSRKDEVDALKDEVDASTSFTGDCLHTHTEPACVQVTKTPLTPS